MKYLLSLKMENWRKNYYGKEKTINNENDNVAFNTGIKWLREQRRKKKKGYYEIHFHIKTKNGRDVFCSFKAMRRNKSLLESDQ